MSFSQNISSLNIPIHKLKNIRRKGYHTVHDVFNNNEISSSLNLEELTRTPETKTALQLQEERKNFKCISSFIGSLDEILNGVLKCGVITELVGLPGSGRTQLCLHLSVSAQMVVDNIYSETVYICTNMNFSISRLREIARNYIRQCENFKNSSIDSILQRIHYVDIMKIADLKTLLDEFELFLREHKAVNLVIIDSITYPLRQVESSEKTPVMYNIVQRLRLLAKKYGFTVVVTNDMTTVIGTSDASTVPSLRDSFYHIINNRIILSQVNNTFEAQLTKSSVKFPDRCTFNFLDSCIT